MGNRFRVGIVGAGQIAEVHARILRAMPETDLVAVCDDLPDKAAAFQKTWGIPSAYGSLDAMLASDRPDAVHVLAPPAAHVPLAMRCITAGCHVMVEKPLGISAGECRKLNAIADRAGRRVAVNHNLAFNPAIGRLIQTIRSRQLGRIEHVTICYNMPLGDVPKTHFICAAYGNLVLELGPHPISVIHRLVGKTVCVAAVAGGDPGRPYCDTWQAGLICERGSAQLYLASGGEFVELWVHVVGQDGSAFVDLRRQSLRVAVKRPSIGYLAELADGLDSARSALRDSFRNFSHYLLGTIHLAQPFDPYYQSMYDSVHSFYSALLTGTEPPAGGEQGLAAVETCESIIAAGTRRMAAGEQVV